ncbi:hypothetical protein M404DRAFT_136422, partial [Pisolithus tinctorius Marx 270]
QTFEVVVPGPECFKNSKQFLVMGVIIQFWGRQSLGVECDQMNLAVAASDRQNASDGIVRCIGLDGDRDPGDEVTALLREVPRSPLAGKPSQWYDDVRIIKDKPAIEVGKAKERLNVLDLARLRPVANGLDLFLRHREAGRGEVESEVFDQVRVELAFLQLRIKAMKLKPAEDFSDMLLVRLLISGVD